MPGPIKLEPKKTTLIVIDMINAIAKGQGPPYTVPPNRQGVIDQFQRLIAHCRSVGTPIIYCTNERRPDGLDATKTITDVQGDLFWLQFDDEPEFFVDRQKVYPSSNGKEYVCWLEHVTDDDGNVIDRPTNENTICVFKLYHMANK